MKVKSLRSPSLLIGLLILMSFAHCQVATLKQQAIVNGPNITLGDLATLAGVDSNSALRLNNLSIGASPRVGIVQRLQRDIVEQRVRALTNGLDIRWSGETQVVVQRAAVTIPGSEILDKAAVYLYEVLGVQGQRVSIQALDELADISVIQGRVELRSRAMPYAEALRKRATVWVDVYVDGQFFRAVSVAFLVEVWRNAWVSRVSVSAGDTVRCQDIEQREMNLTSLPPTLSSGGFLAAPCMGDGFRVRRALAQGDALVVNGMAPTKGLLAGDVVVLRSRGHGVTVEVPALLVRDTASMVAQHSNQRVQVRYLGRVMDANLRDGSVVELVARTAVGE